MIFDDPNVKDEENYKAGTHHRTCVLDILICMINYCLTKISIRAKRSISRVFSLFIVPSPFFVHCPYKGRINRAESVLTGLKPY